LNSWIHIFKKRAEDREVSMEVEMTFGKLLTLTVDHTTLKLK
jgi:hypothetical protein